MDKTYFAQVAGKWDSMQASMFGDEVRTAAIEHANLHPQDTAVDLGGGTGFLSQGLAPLVASLHIIDHSPEMLAEASKNLSDFSNVTYHLAEGTEIPLPDGSVDAVLANMYLHHVEDPLEAIMEIVRVLRPGGHLVITDLDRHGFEFLKEEQFDVWMGFSRNLIWDWLKQAGLVNILVEDTHETCTSQAQEGDEKAEVSIFVASASRPHPEMGTAVREHYSEIAASGSSCCGPSNSSACCDPAPLQGAIPLDVIQEKESACCSSPFSLIETDAEISLGCGNPVGLASLRSGEVVLDIGSGAGADVFPAAKRVGEQGKVIGLDMLPEMLERARATAQARGYSNVEFRQGDAQAIPLPGASVDVVMSNCVINLVQDKGLAFREAYRVLKRGGRLSVSDIVTDRPFSPALRTSPDSWSECVTGALTEREYLALIAQAGFKEIQAARSQAMDAGDGTQVYSLNLTALKN
jgi:ubiquinone/menaquinone biosynthesis C-methylase UbiE